MVHGFHLFAINRKLSLHQAINTRLLRKPTWRLHMFHGIVWEPLSRTALSASIWGLWPGDNSRAIRLELSHDTETLRCMPENIASVVLVHVQRPMHFYKGMLSRGVIPARRSLSTPSKLGRSRVCPTSASYWCASKWRLAPARASLTITSVFLAAWVFFFCCWSDAVQLILCGSGLIEPQLRLSMAQRLFFIVQWIHGDDAYINNKSLADTHVATKQDPALRPGASQVVAVVWAKLGQWSWHFAHWDGYGSYRKETEGFLQGGTWNDLAGSRWKTTWSAKSKEENEDDNTWCVERRTMVEAPEVREKDLFANWIGCGSRTWWVSPSSGLPMLMAIVKGKSWRGREEVRVNPKEETSTKTVDNMSGVHNSASNENSRFAGRWNSATWGGVRRNQECQCVKLEGLLSLCFRCGGRQVRHVLKPSLSRQEVLCNKLSSEREAWLDVIRRRVREVLSLLLRVIGDRIVEEIHYATWKDIFLPTEKNQWQKCTLQRQWQMCLDWEDRCRKTTATAGKRRKCEMTRTFPSWCFSSVSVRCLIRRVM